MLVLSIFSPISVAFLYTTFPAGLLRHFFFTRFFSVTCLAVSSSSAVSTIKVAFASPEISPGWGKPNLGYPSGGRLCKKPHILQHPSNLVLHRSPMLTLKLSFFSFCFSMSNAFTLSLQDAKAWQIHCEFLNAIPIVPLFSIEDYFSQLCRANQTTSSWCFF